MKNSFYLTYVIALGGSLSLPAQTPATSPKFDVASVRIVQFQRGATSYRSDPGRIDYHQIWIENLILKAYPVADYQIVWPQWVVHQPAYYDVSATMRVGTTKEQLQAMLQELLADRFGFSMHREMRPTKVYAAEISPRGLKLRKAQNPPADDEAMSVDTSFSPKNRTWGLSSKRAGVPDAPSGLTVARFLQVIPVHDRPIVDMTELQGYYDMDLNVVLDSLAETPSDTIGQTGGRTGAANVNSPTTSQIFEAMEKQLGLRVEAKTIPVEMLVIDHLQRIPTEN